MKKVIGIYFITNKRNGKVYVGKSSNIKRRKACHRRYYGLEKRPRGVNERLFNAYKKYAWEDFEFSIL